MRVVRQWSGAPRERATIGSSRGEFPLGRGRKASAVPHAEGLSRLPIDAVDRKLVTEVVGPRAVLQQTSIAKSERLLHRALPRHRPAWVLNGRCRRGMACVPKRSKASLRDLERIDRERAHGDVRLDRLCVLRSRRSWLTHRERAGGNVDQPAPGNPRRQTTLLHHRCATLAARTMHPVSYTHLTLPTS